MERFYIAGPFFNSEQVELIRTIEHHLDHNGFPYFSPRKQHRGSSSSPPPKIDTPERARAVFDANIYEMQKADGIIFVLDWLLPSEHELRVVKSIVVSQTVDGPLYEPAFASGPLNLPDTGTVFEMGYCAALGKKMALLKMTDIGALNIMLSVPARGVMYGHSGLERFLHMTPSRKLSGEANWSSLETWKGGLI